jgi:hypothetical protein
MGFILVNIQRQVCIDNWSGAAVIAEGFDDRSKYWLKVTIEIDDN